MSPLDERTLRRLLDGDVTGAQYAAIGVLDEERTRLERFITRGIDAEALRGAFGAKALRVSTYPAR
jgi:hypothetical protein